MINSHRLWENHFRQFETRDNPSLSAALDAAMQFCLAMGSATAEPYWLTLLGPSGTGKTMLARGISRFFAASLDSLLDENKTTPTARYYRAGGFKAWERVVADMLEGDFSGIRDLRDDWFVCLDDIGAEYARNRDISVSKLYEVLNARERKFTVITANLTLQDINTKLDARIASRLLRNGSVVVDVEASDFNL